MGNCVQVKKVIDGSKVRKTVAHQEHEILKLMYHDLEHRSVSKGITREQFDIFFHLNGLWSSQIYRKFDKHKKGYISFQDFEQNMLSMTTGDFNKKSKILYQLYNEEKSQGISSQVLTKMFFSYPKEEINKFVIDEQFLKTIDKYQLTCFFDDEHKIKDNMTFQMTESIFIDKQFHNQIHSIGELGKLEMGFSSPSKGSVPTSKEILQHRGKVLNKMPFKAKYSMEIDPEMTQIKQRKNSYSNEKDNKKKNFKITSNLSFLVKKYVGFLFESFHVDIKKGFLNLENFRKLLKSHEQIFNIYLQGFHTYVWQYDESGFPLYKSIGTSFESEALERVKAQKTHCYLLMVKTTLFVFASKFDSKPRKIINLDGLYVKQSDFVDNCFVIFHRDGIYPEKQFQFQTNQLKNQWMGHLSDFVKGNVNDDFEFIETVGTGKFARVFYGKQKSTKHEVALKMIEMSKLSKIQRESIQKQVSILQLCHNPYIIKFYKHYETKNNLCIVTEFIKQGDLFQYVKQKVFLEEYESAVIFKQLLEAIQYLNELGVIHRDLKPQNIMIQLNQSKTQVKRVKLIDFGFAIFKKQLEISKPQEKFVGTPGFIAPEILFGQYFDESADMFSLGIILYFMLSGYLPFYSQSYEQIIEQTKFCNVALTDTHWSRISKPGKDLVQGLLSFKDDRMSFKQVIECQWLKNIQKLRQLKGANHRQKSNSKPKPNK